MRPTSTILIASALAVAGCSGGGGGGPDSGGEDADGTGDGGGDAAADAPPVGPEDCPRNSAWPCTCDRRDPCDDGSPCVALPWGATGLGVCAAACDSTRPPAAQCPEEPFGAPGWCQLRESPTGAPTNCLLICAVSTVCPSDQGCVDPGIEGVPGYCLPEGG